LECAPCIALKVILQVFTRILYLPHMRINDWLPIVFNSPFVPMNREYIFAEGLDAGLKGNFMIAAHLLIPQVENSMRVLLNQLGINTTIAIRNEL